MPFVWAAYRMGSFGKWQAGLTQAELTATVESTVARLLHIGGDALALTGFRKDNQTVGVMGVITVEPAQMQMWPHVVWFPWASPRNKIECILRFLVEAKERVNLVIPAMPQDVDFFSHLCRYGVIRRIGIGRGWLGDTDVVLYETVRRER